jgi:hypothetical protein
MRGNREQITLTLPPETLNWLERLAHDAHVPSHLVRWPEVNGGAFGTGGALWLNLHAL